MYEWTEYSMDLDVNYRELALSVDVNPELVGSFKGGFARQLQFPSRAVHVVFVPDGPFRRAYVPRCISPKAAKPIIDSWISQKMQAVR